VSADSPTQIATDNGTGSRLRSVVRGPFARLTRWYGRRSYGGELAPVDAFLHHRRLLLGYGAFEAALERSSKLDDRYKALGEVKAAAVVGCEWCMDFGSRIVDAPGRRGAPVTRAAHLPR
jgi:alkylhydroperoxidase family enzyme